MGLLGMAARTAVVAGTATHVAGNVQRRQERRWAQKDAAQQPVENEPPAPSQAPPQAYAAPAPAYPPPPPAYAPPPAPPTAPPGGEDLVARLQQLSELHAQGAITDEEFSAAKAKLLGG
jgi:Short C-terminal domain